MFTLRKEAGVGFTQFKAALVCFVALLFLSAIGCQQFTEEVKVKEMPSTGSLLSQKSRISPGAQYSQAGTNVKVKQARLNERPYASLQSGTNLNVRGLVKLQ